MKWNILALLALVSILPHPAVAQEEPLCIEPGTDLWTTGGTGSSVIQSFPPGFFCPFSPALDLDIQLRGEPLLPGTALGSTDTVVERFEPLCLQIGESGETLVAVRALCLKGTTDIAIPNCGTWQVVATTGSSDDPERQIEEIQSGEVVSPLNITRTHDSGGTFTSSLLVSARLVFTQGSTSREAETVVQFDDVTGTWATSPGDGGLQVGDFDLDTTCGNVPVLASLPGNGNGFHPGWDSSVSPTVAVPVAHRGDDERHKVQPVPPADPCPPEVVQLLGDTRQEESVSAELGFQVLSIDGGISTSSGDRVGILVPCRIATEEAEQVIVPEGNVRSILTVRPVITGSASQ